jgi:hypothetical protein
MMPTLVPAIFVGAVTSVASLAHCRNEVQKAGSSSRGPTVIIMPTTMHGLS